MKIAFYNIQNIFHRDRSLVEQSMSESLKRWREEFETLLLKKQRKDRDYSRMRELSFLLGFQKAASEPYVVMRRRQGSLYIRKRNHSLDYKANSLTDWNGWIKLGSVPINEQAIINKAKVIAEVNPDVLILQEVEDRASLVEFNRDYLSKFMDAPYEHILSVEGNDYKGIGMAIMVKKGYCIESVMNFAHVLDQEHKPLFDQHLQLFKIRNTSGERFLIASGYFVDQHRDKESSDKLRLKQSGKLQEVYSSLQEIGNENIIIVGTFGVPSYCHTLAPLIRASNLKEITKHPSFKVSMDRGKDRQYFSLGAYRKGVNIKQKDYILLSPSFFDHIINCGMIRKGIWSNNRAQWPVFNSLKSDLEQASSHPILWMYLSRNKH
ncbi:hypothetical protein MQE36_14770 [Zhouia spongiae]|uniref:Endonuclease/exonuclease/phosphatase family protein n=1 Tax=Zhouia spongiae TaxID=2202721 RepID=A0ABY3YKY6_9FLAO|nr:hypothetical protein [Zhouia spongiae]UNY98336.1 hypothetical protein MQE36_14770 [Zhouia spongiae]